MITWGLIAFIVGSALIASGWAALDALRKDYEEPQ